MDVRQVKERRGKGGEKRSTKATRYVNFKKKPEE
jgi:hypothetical protein